MSALFGAVVSVVVSYRKLIVVNYLNNQVGSDPQLVGVQYLPPPLQMLF